MRRRNSGYASDEFRAVAGTPAVLVTVAGRPRVRDGVVLGLDPLLAGRVSDSVAALVAWRHGLPPH